MGFAPEHEEEDLGWEWLKHDEEKMKKVKEVIGGITETRRKLFVEPYCRELRFSFPRFHLIFLYSGWLSIAMVGGTSLIQ